MRWRYQAIQHSQLLSMPNRVSEIDTMLVEKTHRFLLGLSCLQEVGTKAIADVSRLVARTRRSLPGPRCRLVVGIDMSTITTTTKTEGKILRSLRL